MAGLKLVTLAEPLKSNISQGYIAGLVLLNEVNSKWCFEQVNTLCACAEFIRPQRVWLRRRLLDLAVRVVLRRRGTRRRLTGRLFGLTRVGFAVISLAWCFEFNEEIRRILIRVMPIRTAADTFPGIVIRVIRGADSTLGDARDGTPV